MNVLMVGDVFGESGRAAAVKLIPRLRQEHAIDMCVVNVENAAGGFGVTPPMCRQFLEAGADVMTSGNHIWDKREIVEYITKENLLLRPANFPVGAPGVGHVTIKAGPHRVAVLNLMGRVFMTPIDHRNHCCSVVRNRSSSAIAASARAPAKQAIAASSSSTCSPFPECRRSTWLWSAIVRV